MIWSLETLRGYTLRATDGTIGEIKDVLFDESQWMLRYLVVDPDKWLLGRRVLIAVSALGSPDGAAHAVPVSLTGEQVKITQPGTGIEGTGSEGQEGAAPGLRSGRDIERFHIRAKDGAIGHVENLLIDEDGWKIRYLVVDTRNWLPGKRVIVAPDWVQRIDWDNRQVVVDLTRAQVENSPAYRATESVERGYEDRLYGYYGRMPYW